MARAVTAAIALVAVAAAVAASALGRAGSSGSTRDAVGATAKFRDPAVAKHAGYGLLKDKKGIACIAMDGMPQMAMGLHYVSGPLVADDVLNTSAPEALVYSPESGGLRLAAVEYIVLKAAWDAKHAAAPSLFGHTFNLTPAGNRFGLPAYYSLHAWLWKHNPAGTFAMWNPKVSCR